MLRITEFMLLMHNIRLKDKFNKPVIIISLDDDIGKASARSIPGFDIGSVIISAVHENLLLKGGGHKMAGGFSIKIENIDKFAIEEMGAVQCADRVPVSEGKI